MQEACYLHDMNATGYIDKLDAFVKVIQPGLFAFAIALLVIEALVLVKIKKVNISHKGGAVSYISGLFGFGFEAIADAAFYLAICYWLYEHRVFELGFAWYVWLFAFLLFDLMFYISHRIQHEVRGLWVFHAAHHSTPEMRLTSAIRGSMFDFIYTPPFYIWMCLIGVHPLMFIAVRTLSRIWGILEHINDSIVGKLPLLNKVFITPDVHRVHHGKNLRYLDRNYSEIFSIWDRMFGTYEEYGEKPEYGILKEIDTNNFADVQFASVKELWKDVRLTKGFKNKLKLLVMPPGWYPDGRDFTAKTLRRQALTNNQVIRSDQPAVLLAEAT